jgi:hypothetical protein
MPGAPSNLLKPKLLSRQIFVPKYWRNYFSPFGKPICQIELPNRYAKSKYLIELPNRQIEFVLPNRIAKLNCRIIKLNSFCRIEMPNRITKSIWQTF